MHVLIYGADGATGSRLVRQALERGHRVRASVHSLGDLPMKAEGLEWVETDVLDAAGPIGDMAGVDAVLNAVGIDAGPSTVISPPPLHSEGTQHILEAMRGAGVDRLVTISATFVETMSRGPIWFEAAARLGLASIFEDMGKMERMLSGVRDVRWTAVRPGWLLEADPSGAYRVFEDVIPEDLIRTRTGDLAAFMLDCAEDDLHVHGTPAIAREEPAEVSGPDAVLKEMVG
jgi:putative NADH-flavin reductase